MNERIIDDGDTELIAADITHGAFANPHLKRLLDHFGKTIFGRASVCMEFENFLQRIGARGECCLEIGTFYGISAVVLSQYFDKVICVSVDNQRDRQKKFDVVNFLHIRNIEFHDVENNAEKDALIKKLEFDFCYQDGDHTRDTRADFELVKRCGRILFHEAWPLQAPVWNLVNSLPKEEVTWAQYDALAYWNQRG